jgi:hypothetical protein
MNRPLVSKSVIRLDSEMFFESEMPSKIETLFDTLEDHCSSKCYIGKSETMKLADGLKERT